MRQLEAAGLPFAAINKPSTCLQTPTSTAAACSMRISRRESGAARRPALPKLPLEMDGNRTELRQDLPAAGEHSRQAARRAGYAADAIESLLAAGVIAEC